MRQPLCPYFGTCAGCDTQHLEYELQLKNKVKSLSSFTNFQHDKIEVFHDQEYHYRNRMDFVFQSDKLGLRAKGNSIIDVKICPISNDRLNEFLAETRVFFDKIKSYNLKPNTFLYAVIRTPSMDSSVSFVINDNSPDKTKAIGLVKEFSKKSKAENVVIGYAANNEILTENFIVAKGKENLKDKFLGKVFFFHSQGFFQNNSSVAEKMISYVKTKLSSKKGHLLDLYGGVGVFGLSTNELFDKVTIVESFPLSVKYAEENIKFNKIKNAEAICMDAKNINKLKFSRPLHAVTDPPRTGMGNIALQKLIELKPETIIYVSCNPLKFKKEFIKFNRNGYKISSVALFDMFPQTNHIEAVVEMNL
ncbi:MAG: 23S rRNA (uracil(1939)-C(5))-methyltransferase RlmD [Nanoarchaeota archaeon]